MRRCNGLATVIIACLTVGFVVFNKTIMEPNELTSNTVVPTPPDAWKYPSSLQKSNSVQSQTHRYVTQSLAELGGRHMMPEMSEDTLMVTRVPGAGAELLVLILQRLQGLNSFKHVRMPPGDDTLLTTLQQELLVEDITTIIRREALPLTFDSDVRFLNFSSFGRQAPTFVSMVRDPSDRKIISRYRIKDVMEMRFTGSIAHFCGQDPRCTHDNRTWALTEAQANVDRWYPVVGLLEHVETTLDVLEQKFPYFFKGASELYSKLHVKKKRKKADDSGKPNNADLERKMFKLNPYLAKEMEFYTWLKSRLLNPKSVNG